MPEKKLPSGCRGDSSTPRQKEILRNCYLDPAETPTLITRPVARSVTRGIGRCRGAGSFKGELYQVSNDKLIRITLIDKTLPPTKDNILIEKLGTIIGTEDCLLDSSFTQLLIIVISGAGYVYDKINGLRGITDPAFKVTRSIAFDTPNWVFVPMDGDPFQFCTDSNLNADPTNAQFEFADAEEFTDLNKYVIARKRQILIGGERSIQRLQYNPTTDTYSEVQGTTSNYGIVGGVTDFGDTFMFIGQGVNGGFSFFIMGSLAQPVPNKYVDEILSKYSLNDLENVRSESFNWFNMDFAVFYLPNETIVFCGDFVLWHSAVLGEYMGPWTVSFMQAAYGYIWTGDKVSAEIGILADDDNEYEQPLEFRVITYLRGEPHIMAMVKRIQLDLNSGANKPGQSIGLSVSTDGMIYGPTIYRPLGKPGDYNAEVFWGPVAILDSFLGIQLEGVGSMRISIDKLTYKI